MSTFFKRLICLVLAFTMVFCALPAVNAQDASALAEEIIYEEIPEEAETEEVPTEEPQPEEPQPEEPQPDEPAAEQPAPEEPSQQPPAQEEEELVLMADEEPLIDGSTPIADNGSRLILDFDPTEYPDANIQWLRSADGSAGSYQNIPGAENYYYDLTPEDSGKHLRVAVDEVQCVPVHIEGRVVVFDLALQKVAFNTTVTGKAPGGTNVSLTHNKLNRYIVTQSTNTYTTNEITFAGNFPNAPFDVTLDGVNMGNADSAYKTGTPNTGSVGETYTFGSIDIPTTGSSVKHVLLRLKGENIMRNIRYYNGSNASTLTFTHINGDGESDPAEGSLYLPKKVAPEDIDAFVASNVNYNHWDSAIGAVDGSSYQDVRNIIINGGFLQVLTTYADNCTAIGGGGNGFGGVTINGGEVIAHCNGTGAAIGGGIGWKSYGGAGNVVINGGKVYAKNHSYIGVNSSNNPVTNLNNAVGIVGGVAIGGGSSFHSTGAAGTVIINGGEVEAYGTFGNALGGGNSSTSTGGEANITITGGKVTASSIGGGNSQKGVGGDATITVKAPADNSQDPPEVTLSGGIGGGKSLGNSSDNKVRGNGGQATVKVSAGTLTVGGTIGGGEGGGSGHGGQANITVTGGHLTARSIGGGVGSAGGNGGSAVITVSDGTIVTGSIGGGSTKNPTGKLGHAVATISGGDITGQFLMMEADASNPCKFTMTGGTLHGVDTAALLDPDDDTSFRYTMREGGAVYMDDPNGTAAISGGTIEDCHATSGGAIYMTAGTVTISDAAAIQQCSATGQGGAICLEGGTLNIGGGTLQQNSSATDGGAVYMGGGTLNISGGTLQSNTASQNGGAAYLEAGTLNISDGTLQQNSASQNGGAVYLGGGTLTLTGGTLQQNTAINGGAAYVDGGSIDLQQATFSQNTASQNGGAVAVNNGNFTMTGGLLENNSTQNGSGGGLYVSSTTSDVDVMIYSGVLQGNSSAVNGGALAVVGDPDSTSDITVQIGVNKHHLDDQGNRIECEHMRAGVYDCPVLKDNTTVESGGALYMTGNNDHAKLSVFCVTETGSKADGDKDRSNFMRVDGGSLVIATTDDYDPIEQTSIHGHCFIENSFYATGGRVDLWGSTANPYFKDVITVDIIDPENNYFHDYRGTDEYCTLIYFENFADPTTGLTSGQYSSYTYDINTVVTISGNVYEHPGYSIARWNTDPDGYNGEHDFPHGTDTANPDNGWYEVGSTKELARNLVLYAIWDNIGYVVHFEANAPEHLGEMADQTFDYDKEANLSPNLFTYPGHTFLHWNTKPDGSGDSYADKAAVKNLAKQEGDLVTLYAIWGSCSHNPEQCTYTYSVINDGTAIQRVCSCQGYAETASLTGYDLTYDKAKHPVTYKVTTELIGSSASFTPAWTWQPALSYAKEGNAGYDPNAVPVNAGSYTATITYAGHTAQASCIIQKAEQPAPPKPQYRANIADTSKLDVSPVAPSPLSDPTNPLYDPTYDAVPQYQVVYKVGDTVYGGDLWKDGVNSDPAATFNLDVALTNYYVYARYGESENYKASPATEADGQHFFKGNIRIDIKPGRGVNYSYEVASQNGDVVTGIRIMVSAKDGFYFPNSYGFDIKTYEYDGESLSNPLVEKHTSISTIQEEQNKSYRLDNIPEGTYIVVTLHDLEDGLSVSGMIDHGKQYGLITNTAGVNISRDSAYTAYFVARNYNDSIYGGSSTTAKPCISFSTNLPVGTRITMQSRNADDSLSYYRYQVASATNSIELDDFIRMGTASTPFAPHDGTLRLRFVVDFSLVNSGNYIDLDTLSTTLAMTANQAAAAYAPSASATVETALSDVASFELTAVGSGLEQTFTYTYNSSDGEASIWENRRTALILSPSTLDLPADVYISYRVGATQRTRKAYPNSEGDFVIPLSYLEEGPNDVVVTLVSGNFPANAAYDMAARWMVSNTGEDNASNNGTMVAALNQDITFTKDIASAPALKISAEKPSYPMGGSFDAVAQWSDVQEADELTIQLMVKTDRGVYTNTGWNTVVKREGEDHSLNLGENVSISLAGQREGSYCLHLTAMRGLIRVAEDYYYFVVTSNGQENLSLEETPNN